LTHRPISDISRSENNATGEEPHRMRDANRDKVGPNDRRSRSAGLMTAIALQSIVTATRSNGQDAPPIPGGATADLFRKGAGGFPAEAPPSPPAPWHDPAKPLP
jgi:hypothetical protein